MSIFKNLFSVSEEETSVSKINWIPLTTLGQLDEIALASNEKPIAIFKHSTRCSISRMALKEFEREYDLTDESILPYFLDLLSFREISNEIAQRFNVIHQSPQLIVIKNGIAIYATSHSDIDAVDLKTQLNTL